MEREKLLKDVKEDLFPDSKGDSIKLIMKFFATDSEDENIEELEHLKYNKEVYEALGWQSEKYFDVINSFWTVFTCAVIREVHDNKEYGRLKRFYQLPDYKNHFSPWIPGGKNGYYSTKNGKKRPSFSERYLSPEFPGIKPIVNSTVNSYPRLNDLAALTHSVANFMPCPPSPNYNSMKNMRGEENLPERVFDFFPLLIDFIEKHSNDKKKVDGIAVDIETLPKWKEWFITNRDKYCLEDYYIVYSDQKNIKHIKGIPFFKTQSLNNPLPRTEGEVTECLDTMIWRIRERANRLSKQQGMQTSEEDEMVDIDAKDRELLDENSSMENLGDIDAINAQILDETYFDMYGDRPGLEHELEEWDGYEC